MKNRLFLFLVLVVCILTTTNVNAAGKATFSLACPGAAKPNTEIKCIVYGMSSGSKVESIEDITAKPSGTLKKADYFVDYDIIPVGTRKNIGSIVIQTGNVGTGKIELVFDAIHFVDGSYQESVSVKKSIVINKTGTLSNNNSQSSSTNNSSNSNTNTNSNSNSNSNSNTNANNNTSQSGDAYLQGIKVSRGILSPSFSRNVYSYTVKVDYDVATISIDGIKGDVSQKVEGEISEGKLKFGSNTFKLTVTNGNAKKVYTIVIIREDKRDTNALLSTLSLSSGVIQFSPSVYEYETKVLYEVSRVDVVATPEKETSRATIAGNTDLKVGLNTIEITVTSQKGNTQKYVVKITRLNEGETIGNNANIKSITVTGYEFLFDYSKTSYKLVIKNDDKLDMDVVMDDPSASYDILGNNNLKDGSVITIKTKSYDGTETKTYRIEITKPSYTMYYVIGGLLIALAIAIPVAFYLRYVKFNKDLVDINGNRISKEEARQNNYRKKLKTTLPNKKNKNELKEETIQPVNNVPINTVVQNNANPVNNTVDNTNSTVVQPTPQYVVNIQENPAQNVVDNVNQSTPDLSSGKCPKCGRELLGTPSICPYCNTKLK